MKWKIDLNIVESYKAFAAGILIGFGVIINSVTANPIVGAVLFSFGLLAIIALKLPLYTGRVGFWKEPTLFPEMLVANVAGALGATVCYAIATPDYLTLISNIGAHKFEKTYLQMLFCGILCGALIHFAVKIKQTPITIFAVVIFILIGAEHCIADFPFLMTNFSLVNLIKWFIIVLGNSLGALFIEKLTKEYNYEICSNNS